jgi:hypothetical protein
VLDLFAEDVHAGLNAAVGEKWQELVQFLEGLWDKYHVSERVAMVAQLAAYDKLNAVLQELGYAV